MEFKIVSTLISEWGAIGLLAALLFYLIVDQRKQHKENIRTLSENGVAAMDKIVDAILIQSDLLDEIKATTKITRKECFEHRRKFEDYVITTTARETRLETVLDIVQDNTKHPHNHNNN